MRISSMSLMFSLVLAGLATGQQPEEMTTANPVAEDQHGLRPPHETAELVELAQQARESALAFLVETQNTDGSWGSHDPQIARLRDFGFVLLDRGAQDGVRTACTAMRKPVR